MLRAPAALGRVVGRAGGDADGPTIVVTAALHGNEPAGLLAAERVLRRLADMPVRGETVVLAGNLAALDGRTRFVDVDLNRQWTPERVRTIQGRPRSRDTLVEQGQQRDLLEAIRPVVERARGTVHFLDLHTSSAEGPPFLTVGDTLRNRAFAERVPLPLILGLEEQIDGSMLEYLNNLGFVTLGVEAGQHDSPDSVDRIEAVLWLALAAAGAIDEADAPDAGRARAMLRDASRGIPRVIEVKRRHAITPADDFAMEPGFRNFMRVRRGQRLASDHRGAILAPEDGLILLPLYQGKGDDGFFIAGAVRPVWLGVSGALRRLRLDRLMTVLPGVRRHPEREGELIVDTRVARFYPLDVFHLFGFRKQRADGTELIVSRRRYDLAAPERIRL